MTTSELLVGTATVNGTKQIIGTTTITTRDVGWIAELIENWPFTRIVPDDDDAIYDFLAAYELQLDELQLTTDVLLAQRFLGTATGSELEKLSSEVGKIRATNETDERLRFRARISKAVTRSDGTIDSIGEILTVIFGDDAQRIDVSTPTSEPVVRLIIPTDVIDEIPLTVTALERELTDIIPVGDSLVVLTDDTFVFGQSGSQGLSEGGLS